MLSGRGLCDKLITRPEESYQLCCVVVCDLETSRIGAPYIYDISSLRVKDLSCKSKGSGIDVCWFPRDFLLIYSFQPRYDPEVDQTSNRNNYQGYFLVGKGGRCLGLTTLPPSYADCFYIWESQTPGTLKACPGLYKKCFMFYLYLYLLHPIFSTFRIG